MLHSPDEISKLINDSRLAYTQMITSLSRYRTIIACVCAMNRHPPLASCLWLGGSVLFVASPVHSTPAAHAEPQECHQWTLAAMAGLPQELGPTKRGEGS